MGRGLPRPRPVLRVLLVLLRRCQRGFVSPIHNNKPATRSEVLYTCSAWQHDLHGQKFSPSGSGSVSCFSGKSLFGLNRSLSSGVSGRGAPGRSLALKSVAVWSSTAASRARGPALRAGEPPSSVTEPCLCPFGPPDCELIYSPLCRISAPTLPTVTVAIQKMSVNID